MKIINKITIFSIILTSVLLWSCEKADEEFIHDSNIISQMICTASHTAGEYRGNIYEFDKNGAPLADGFTQAEAEGGYGIILFEISQSLQDDVDLKNIYLKASLTWDQSISPSLTGRHDITGDGKIFTVTSGTGTTRQYRVKGEYQ